MIKLIPDNILAVYKKIREAGFEVYFVGGCVRDILMKRKVKDWDLTTSAKPEKILKLFPDGFYDNKFGTVGIPFKKNGTTIVFEVTTFRKEGEYKDLRHPEKIEWAKTIVEDLARRDFTINAIALR